MTTDTHDKVERLQVQVEALSGAVREIRTDMKEMLREARATMRTTITTLVVMLIGVAAWVMQALLGKHTF